MKTEFIIVACLLCACGCASTTPHAAPPVVTQTSTPEETFVSPTGHVTIITSTPTPAPTGQFYSADPIIGGWTLFGAPYPCEAVFVENGDGHITCGVFPMSQQRDLSWSNAQEGNATYHIVIDDTSQETVDAVINDNGTLTSGILPDGSYLVKK